METRYYTFQYLRMKEGAIAPSNEFKDMELYRLAPKNLHALIEESIIIAPGTWAELATGIAISTNHTEEVEIESLIKQGLIVRKFKNVWLKTNVKSTPENEIRVLFYNIGNAPVTINNGDALIGICPGNNFVEMFEEQEEA